MALLAAGCGDDSSVTDAGGPTPTPTPTSTPTVGSEVARLPADRSAPATAWTEGINDAGWRFHLSLPDGNAVSSPISIGTAFSFARAGASDDTERTLDDIFGLPDGIDAHRAANAALTDLAAADGGTTTLEIANRLFPDLDFSPAQDFVDVGVQYYGSGVQPIETSDGEVAAAAINGWVDEQTHGLIDEIVTPDIVLDKRLFLVNTVYLFAEWVDPFLADLTTDRPFTTSDGSSVTVPFMTFHEPEPRRFVRLADADAVELPYADGDLAMWLIVPHDIDGLADLESSFDAADITGLSGRAESGTVQLAMPKWEQELPPTDLFEWLCPEGLCPGAEFDGISPGLFITDALHGARIIVDEKGTEAAAVTALGFNESAPPAADLTVTADHPFLWAIVHEPTASLVFVGRITDPTAG